MAEHPGGTSHKPTKPKPSIHVTIEDVQGLSSAEINDQFTITASVKVMSLRVPDSFEKKELGESGVQMTLEIEDISLEDRRPKKKKKEKEESE